MRKVTVSKRTIEAMDEFNYPRGTDLSEATIHKDGSVTFDMKEETYERLRYYDDDIEKAILVALNSGGLQ